MRQKLYLLMLAFLAFSSCATISTPSPVDVFSKNQRVKISEASAFHEAELLFHAYLYEPRMEDFDSFRQAWHAFTGNAPISTASFAELESEVRKGVDKVLVLALFASDYDSADLKNQGLGWSFFPTPLLIKELKANDDALRVLMPIANEWVRYFMVTVSTREWFDYGKFILGRHQNKVEFTRAPRSR